MGRLCFCFLIFLTQPVLANSDIRIVGSDLLGDELASEIQNYARQNEWVVSIGMEGSLKGWGEIQDSQADIGLLSFSPEETLPAAPFYAAPIAYHTVMILATTAVSLNQISLTQLAGVFCHEESSAWPRLSDVGVIGDASTRNVIPLVWVGSSNLLIELFRLKVMHSQKLRADINRVSTEEELSRIMLSEEAGIALSALTSLSGIDINTVAVSRELNDVAYLPTPLAVHRGDYPLSWPLYVVFRQSEVTKLYPILRFLLSEESAMLLRRARLVPIPDSARLDLLNGLERLEK